MGSNGVDVRFWLSAGWRVGVVVVVGLGVGIGFDAGAGIAADLLSLAPGRWPWCVSLRLLAFRTLPFALGL